MRRSVSIFGLALILSLLMSPQSFAGLTRISEGVYSYIDTKGAAPANSFGANAGIIIGKDGILVVDTLISAKKAKAFINDIKAVSDKPIKYVVNTHYHLDHSLGNSEFARLGAIIIGQQNSIKDLSTNSPLPRASEYGLSAEDMEGTTMAPPLLTFTDRMAISLGDLTVELIYPGPSHTDDSILVYLPGQKVLFAGDILFTRYHPYMGEGDAAGWIKSLDFVSSLDADKIIPGHGPLSGKQDVDAMRTYITTFDKKVKELAAVSNDPQFISAEVKKVLPAGYELEFMIPVNVQKYIKK
ncbi:MAG TPA: MBL fold metallo-hydrolase [Thermodesulfovibrionales bacterium]|nr:MBL fold metallo-hydrolase [Thermodesulfovibrionales bacterium]